VQIPDRTHKTYILIALVSLPTKLVLLFRTYIYIYIQVKEDEMGRACRTNGVEEECI
jgi:hypothetical protein